jgi:hypothetical protein
LRAAFFFLPDLGAREEVERRAVVVLRHALLASLLLAVFSAELRQMPHVHECPFRYIGSHRHLKRQSEEKACLSSALFML